MIQMHLFTKQKQIHRLQKQTYDYQRGKLGGGKNLEFGIDIYTYRIDNQQGSTV